MLQNMAEFWNTSTRPVERNGFGLSVDTTERIVLQHRVSGVQVHDARLAAAMYAHGISHILTFNGSDFMRYPGITTIHPDGVGK